MSLSPRKDEQPLSATGRGLSFCGLRVAMDATRAESKTLAAEHGRFVVEKTGGEALDLGGLLALPGLLNAHDHLEFALFPRLGEEGRYHNAREWAERIYRPDASPIREHLRIPKPVRMLWGGLRNLLGGVTAVCHHNPYSPSVFDNAFPVRVVREIGFAHSLAFENDVAARFTETPAGRPFVIHAAEGVDAEARAEIALLDRLGVLSDRTVLVHATACSDEEWALLARRGGGVVWCPLSNGFLFGKTLAASMLRQGPAVALGTDSPLTATGGMFEALACAAARGLPPETVYAMVTATPARMLRLPGGFGALVPGAPADWIALRDQGLSPGETLCSRAQLELVCIAGRPMLVSDALAGAHPTLAAGLAKLSYGNRVYWVRADVPALAAAARAELGEHLELGGVPAGC